jgi:hypothetical protein
MLGLQLIFVLVLFLLVVTFIINWIRFRREIQPYRRYGYVAGAIVILLEFAALLASGPFIGAFAASPLVCGAAAIAFLRAAAFTNVGIYYSRKLGHVGFTLLSKRYPIETEPGDEAPFATSSAAIEPAPATSAEDAPETIKETLADPTPVPVDAQPLMQTPVNTAQALLAGAALAAVSLLFTFILFSISSPRLSDVIRSLPEIDQAQTGVSVDVSLLTILVVLEAAFVEELAFRLAAQNFIANLFEWKNEKYTRAIVLVALLWTFGHVGLVEPGWVKPAQIFPIGLALGWLYRRFGVESCILAHALFNLFGLLFTPMLIN